MSLVLTSLKVEAGGRTILQDVSLTLAEGEAIAVIGPNGAGKSTLIRTAVGLLAPSEGSVSLHGDPLTSLSARARAATLGWLPQRPEVRDLLSAEEVVAAARFRFAESRAASRAAARKALTAVGAAGLADRLVPTLSGGEAQRVALAALAAQQPPLRLLDEPANHLDPAVQLEVYRLLGRWWRDGCGLLVVTHDINLLGHLGALDRITVLGLRDGREAFRCRADDAGLPDALGDLYGVRVTRLEVEGAPHFVMHDAGGRP